MNLSPFFRATLTTLRSPKLLVRICLFVISDEWIAKLLFPLITAIHVRE
jgi:hypothetical protein